ncbi:LysM peptidoglycan-binding domain-containing protein [Arthrobacter sp. AD-310]
MGTEESRAPKAGPLGYGMAPVAVAGGITLLCALGLLGGGFGVVANALAPQTPTGVHAAPAPVEADLNNASGTGTDTAGPTTPPERGSAPAEVAPADTIYLIKWGDTLSQISLGTGVSVERLAEYNSIEDVDLIYAGALLRIPYILIPGDGNAAAPTK